MRGWRSRRATRFLVACSLRVAVGPEPPARAGLGTDRGLRADHGLYSIRAGLRPGHATSARGYPAGPREPRRENGDGRVGGRGQRREAPPSPGTPVTCARWSRARSPQGSDGRCWAAPRSPPPGSGRRPADGTAGLARRILRPRAPPDRRLSCRRQERSWSAKPTSTTSTSPSALPAPWGQRATRRTALRLEVVGTYAPDDDRVVAGAEADRHFERLRRHRPVRRARRLGDDRGDLRRGTDPDRGRPLSRVPSVRTRDSRRRQGARAGPAAACAGVGPSGRAGPDLHVDSPTSMPSPTT